MAGINDIDSSIQNLIKMTNTKATVSTVYENPSPTSAFPNQQLPVDLAGYDLIAIIVNTDTSSSKRRAPAVVTQVGQGGICVNAGGSRRYFMATETYINFDTVYPASATGDCIPALVLGIKLSGGYGLKRIFSTLKRFISMQGGVCYGN